MKRESFSTLNIVGYDKKPIKNTLSSVGKTDKIAILFPGIGYTCQMPLLYYSTNVLLQKGYDVLWVEYNYNNHGFESSNVDEKLRWLNFDADAAYKAAIDHGMYKHVVLVGKSLGTFALVHLNSTKKGIERNVWLTPVLEMAQVVKVEIFSKLREVCKNGLVIMGTDDSHYSKERVDELTERGARCVLIEGGDHSLEIDGSYQKSLLALKQVTKEIEDFIAD